MPDASRLAREPALIFYRHDRESLMAERVLHGARDMPRRSLQSPYEVKD